MRSVPGAAQAVLDAAGEMLRRGLVEGTAGNISARQADGTIVITPAAVEYAGMDLDDLVVIGPGGETLQCGPGRAPSSEKDLHLACYRAFDDVGSVVHAHPVFATMFAVARREIPACIDEFTMYAGGSVRCARYAPSGTAELGTAAVEALRDRGAALLANHGMVAVGADPSQALHVTAVVERSAHIVWGAQMLGPVAPLPGEVDAGFAEMYLDRRRS